ncbi:hypothetical protein [Hyphomicrobium sp.]|jgi:hypothetical protein|uniref:hypothetical protein n=1 Tax=Hyphomicrobium sp. TaxID=82 RepID=UPI002C86595C|nr:hypothetical protein [Hyphomicrobium sp.]HVZ04173.1 hypothetical protein [Hyphomicrobium sp.]
MTKIAFALATALLAGSTLTSAANAGGIRLGFGFPLGSFVAHPTQSYAGDGYGYRKHCARERAARRVYRAEAAPVRRHKRSHVNIAAKKPATPPVVQMAKLEDKLMSNPATTTEIAKTSNITTASTTPAATNSPPAAKTEAPTTDKVATADKTSTDGKSATDKPATEAKQICRRYSAAIAGLIDVPCEE